MPDSWRRALINNSGLTQFHLLEEGLKAESLHNLEGFDFGHIGYQHGRQTFLEGPETLIGGEILIVVDRNCMGIWLFCL